MVKPLQILIVEDEFITQKTISNYLEEIGYGISGLAMSASEAIEILEKNIVNFVILDINIKGEQNGIYLGKYIKEKYNLPFIYLTAYSDAKTISNAIETEPFSYLVKPFQKYDLLAAIEVGILNYNKINQQKKDTILIKHNDVYKKINFDSILYIESQKNYLIIKTIDVEYKYRSTISEFQKQLAKNFIKTHKGFIININKVSSFNSSYIIINENKIPISKSYKEIVTNLFK